MLLTKNKGQMAMLKVQFEAQQRGYAISIPTTEERYDCIIDTGTYLYRTQVKYLDRVGSGRPNCVEWAGGGKADNRMKPYQSTEIDLLLLYIPKVDSIVYISPKQFHNKKTFWFNLKNPQAPTFYKKFLW